MEPLCYINSFALTAAGLYWFGFTKVDPAYRNVLDHVRQARVMRFSRKYGLDWSAYEGLKARIARTEEDLSLWREGSYTRARD